jgi:hypothetical protein
MSHPKAPGSSISTHHELAITAQVTVPILPGQLVSTEAPDGAVFVADLTSTTGAAPQVVWVVDGNGPAAVAEHLPIGANALAADATNFYAANYLNVTAFDRRSGIQSGQWPLPPVSTANTSNANLEAMAATGGAVLVGLAQGTVVSVYRIDPATTAAPVMIAQGSSVAFGPDGSIIYVRADHHLVVQSASGVLNVGPLMDDSPNGSGGGVQYVDTVAGNTIWVSEPAGQGLDARYASFDLTTLTPRGTFSGTSELQIAGTTAGPLALNPPAPCPQPSSEVVSTMCLFRITPSGALSHRVKIGGVLQLLGPHPVVLTGNPGNSGVVVNRLG